MSSDDSRDSYSVYVRKSKKTRRSRTPDDDYRRASKKSARRQRRRHRSRSSSSSSNSNSNSDDDGGDACAPRKSREMPRRRKSRSYSRETSSKQTASGRRKRSTSRSRRKSRDRLRRRSKDTRRSRERRKSRDRRDKRSRSWSKENEHKSIPVKDITPFDLMSKVEQAQARIAQRLGDVAPVKGERDVHFDPVDELERQRRIKDIESDSFVATTFTSSRQKSTTDSVNITHDSIIFGQYNNNNSPNIKQKVKLNTDVEFIINDKFSQNTDLRMEKWKNKLNEMSMKVKNKFSK